MRSPHSSGQLATEIEHTFNRESGAGGTYRFVMKPNIAVQMADDTVTQAIRTIENRVNELGVAEPVVARHGGRPIRSSSSSRASPMLAAPRRSSARQRSSS